ncbi:hypothetical protein [Paenibacillus caui]|uniref:hypothetical protein n=1 Tax=Paenibacillus caui TaxID=2873927 RepID=UPI001CA7BB38|nr:hypothetical protein [Paenibacillus caui]
MSDNLGLGNIRFYDNYLPGLASGNYTIQVKHELGGLGLTDEEQEKLTAVQEVVVIAPQFALDDSEIHSLVPPAGSAGPYADELPHVVLNRRVLPWERAMDNPGVPWMALLVLQQDELIRGSEDKTDAETLAIRTTISEFLQLGKDGDVYIPPALVMDDNLKGTESIYYIRMSGEQFTLLMPTLEELPYLAHVRHLNPDDKAGANGDEEAGWFGVITANRFPAADKQRAAGIQNIVHLVSLEGWSPVLKQGASIPQRDVALVSLARWSFHCQADSEADFEGLMKGLTSGHGQEGDAAGWNLLRLPQASRQAGNDPASQEAFGRLKNGFVPLSYHTRSGEETFAWYRGPLSPAAPARMDKPQPFTTADAALIYDRKNGVFDTSLASAWQIGHSLALSDASFSRLLLEYRRRCHRITDQLYAALEAAGETAPADLAELVQSGGLAKALLAVLDSTLLQCIGSGEIKASANAGTDSRRKAVFLRKNVKRLLTENPADVLKSFMTRPDVRAAVTQLTREDLEPVAKWMAHKMLLYDVPFYHLVPDERMLPQESLRVFYLDQNWTEAMLDGMTSIGLSSSRDSLFHELTKDVIKDAVSAALLHIRNGGSPAQGTGSAFNSDSGLICGFLLRSSVVDGWPGLTVRATDSKGEAVSIVRLDHLSSTVLLCLFQGVPERIEFTEPQEGLQFGLSQEGKIFLRSVVSGNTAHPFGAQLDEQLNVRDRFVRGSRVLDLRPDKATGLVQTAAEAIRQKLNLSSLTLTPSDFALQIVKSPERMAFVSQGSSPTKHEQEVNHV